MLRCVFCVLTMGLTAFAEGAPCVVPAAAETVPVGDADDAADDPCIWVHPSEPESSLVIGTNKNRANGGLSAYRLDGSIAFTVDAPGVNNVDIRQRIRLVDGSVVDIVAASQRDPDGIVAYRLDYESGAFVGLLRDPIRVRGAYGFCLYRSREGRLFGFVTTKRGRLHQWELAIDDDGTVSGSRVGGRRFGSQLEGCVADDERELLYVGEEGRGVWRCSAWPGDRDTPVLVDSVGGVSGLTADVEGLAIGASPNGSGYLVASSQGSNTYVVYDRVPPNRLLGSFVVGSSEGIGGTEETDGIELTLTPSGPSFPAGLFVAQDGVNPPENQNFKLVSWERVMGCAGMLRPEDAQ